MGLNKFQVAAVSPGAARNHLVPSGAAVYAHFVNRELYKTEIEGAQEEDAEPEDQQAIRVKIQQAKLLKRLKTLKVVCCSYTCFILCVANVVVVHRNVLMSHPIG